MTKLIYLLIVTACSVGYTPAQPPCPLDSMSDRDYARAVDAALLDPRNWHLEGTDGSGFVRVVPPGHTWWLGSSFKAQLLAATYAPSDPFPDAYGSGFIRRLGTVVPMPPGSVLVGSPWQTKSQIMYADPTDDIATDPRYCDPEALYYARVRAIDSAPLHAVVVDVGGAGSIDEDWHTDIPASDAASGVIVVRTSTYRGAWATFGPSTASEWDKVNVDIERDNAGYIRTSHSGYRQPFPPTAPGLTMRLSHRKGHPADASGVWPVRPDGTIKIDSSQNPDGNYLASSGSSDLWYRVRPDNF